MLAKTLLADTFSVLLAFGSFAFYMAGFFYPEVHRRTDLVWSGLGLVYAALLWFCVGQMTVAVLLAQPIVVALFLGLGWQTLSVRREKTPVYQQTPISITPEVVSDWTKNRLNQLRIAPKESVPVRLEKRASGQQLDPRRRRAYDYEFVEDGLVEMAPAPDPIAEATEALGDVLGEVLSLEALPVDAEVADAVAGDITVAVPPSVEAKIISVDVPEAAETSASEPSAPEPAVTEPSTAELSTAEPSTAELPTDERKIADVSGAVNASVSTPSLPEDLATTDLATTNEPLSDHDDWGDELFNDPPVERASAPAVESVDSFEPQPAQPPTATAKKSPIGPPREKPSLLATPVILVGWVKDVVTSLTRPKPSKPVIEIPRREPSSAVRTQMDTAAPTTPSTPISNRTATVVSSETSETSVPPAISTVISPAAQPVEPDWVQVQNEASYAERVSAIAPEEDNWEESNWDD